MLLQYDDNGIIINIKKYLQEFQLDSRELTCKLSGLELGSGRSNDSGVASPSEPDTQVSGDWWRHGHVTSILISDWSRTRAARRRASGAPRAGRSLGRTPALEAPSKVRTVRKVVTR